MKLFFTGVVLFISTFLIDFEETLSIVLIILSIILMAPFAFSKEHKDTQAKNVSVDEIKNKFDGIDERINKLRTNVDADRDEIIATGKAQEEDDDDYFRECEIEELDSIMPEIEFIESMKVVNEDDALERLKQVHHVNSKIYFYYSDFLTLDSVGTGEYTVEKVFKSDTRFKPVERKQIEIQNISVIDGSCYPTDSDVLFGFIDTMRQNYEIIVSESNPYSDKMTHFTVLQDEEVIYQISTSDIEIIDLDGPLGIVDPDFSSVSATIGKSLNWFQSVYDFLKADEQYQKESQINKERKKSKSIGSLNL